MTLRLNKALRLSKYLPQTHAVFCLSARLPSGVFRSNFPIRLGSPRPPRHRCHRRCMGLVGIRRDLEPPHQLPPLPETTRQRKGKTVIWEQRVSAIYFLNSLLFCKAGRKKNKKKKSSQWMLKHFSFFFPKPFISYQEKCSIWTSNTNSLIAVRKMLLPTYTHTPCLRGFPTPPSPFLLSPPCQSSNILRARRGLFSAEMALLVN